MIHYLIRAWQLWRTNPRLFYRRLGLFARRPWQSLALIRATGRRNLLIDKAYRDWLTASAMLPAPQIPHDETAPLLSVIVPVFNPAQDVLADTLDSVLAQTYPRWELCIADDASTAEHVRETLQRYADVDNRVKVIYRPMSGHIAAASNSALDLAHGEFVILLDHDDILAPEALTSIAEVVANQPLVDLIYSDEDKINAAGECVTPFFKPTWSPTLLLSANYVTHLAAARRTLLHEIGGFRTETVGSQDHDLFLRLGEHARAVAHIPRILYSWRMVPGSTAAASSAKPYTVAAARRALHDAVARRKLTATLEPSHLNGLFIARHEPPPNARISLVIVGAGEDWRAALRQQGMTVCDLARVPLMSTEHERREQPITRVGDPPLVQSLDMLTGDYIIWLDGAERPAKGALLALLAQLRYEQTGVVGGIAARRGMVLHAGLTIGAGGQPRYAYADLPALPQRNFYLNLKDLARETSAVALGGGAMRRATWHEFGGWRTDLPPALALTDLCLRIQEVGGYTNITTPLAHFSRRDRLAPLPSVAHYAWPWGDYRDPFWNPNLDPGQADGLPFRIPSDPQARIRYRNPRGVFVSTPPDPEDAGDGRTDDGCQ